MSSFYCPICKGSGESSHYGVLDCTEPGCNAATERAEFNTFMAALEPLSQYDRDWAAYRFGRVKQAEQNFDSLAACFSSPALKPQADVLRHTVQQGEHE